MDDNNNFISVGELNRKAKHLLESELGTVQVVGEVSNLAKPSSGHMYFTLKDEDGAVRWRCLEIKICALTLLQKTVTYVQWKLKLVFMHLGVTINSLLAEWNPTVKGISQTI